MPSNDDRPPTGPAGGRSYPGGGELPPELDPRAGRRRATGRSDARPGSAGLPPELDPRGRRTAQAAAARAAAQAGPTSRSGRPPTHRHKSDLLHGLTLGLQVILAICSLLVLVGSGWAWATYRNLNADITRLNAISAKGRVANGGIDGQDQNLLLVGNDDRDSATNAELAQLGTTRDGGSYNTDTMMLLHLPADGSKATEISFPRDSYVTIPGHGKNKLNAAYPIGIQAAHGDKAGGAQLLVQTIENLTGLSIDHFVQIDLLGFYRISNAIGGVDVCLNHAVKEANSGIDLKAGHQLIMGTQALAFVRQRYGFPDGQGDLDRIKRQQYFLSAVFRQISSAGTLLNPLKLQRLLKAISSSLQMDQTLKPLELAKQMQNLQAGNLFFTTIPTAGYRDEVIDGQTQSTVAVDSAAMPDFIDNLIGVDAASALKKAKPADPSSVTVQVVNDTNSNGLETANAKALQAAGFTTQIPAPTSDILGKTTIRYAPGQEAAAKALHAQVPGAVMVRSRQVSGVTLVLGENNVQVKSLMPSKAPQSTPAPTSPSPTSSSAPAVTTAADAGCIN